MDLDIRRVLAARPPVPEQVELAPLITPWGDALDADAVHAAYPRPQLRRASWTNLNGWWEYAIVESSAAADLWRCARPPRVWDGRILVPFSPEASLSGVRRQLGPHQLLWYRRTLALPQVSPNTRLLLHFGAVDHACACYVNGVQVGTNVGGYLPFCLDITKAARAGDNTLELCVHDPSEHGTQLRGKQRLRRGNMWYTAQSGIWQTVWLEEVPERHVTSLELCPDADKGRLKVVAHLSKPGSMLSVDVLGAGGETIAHASVPATEPVATCALPVDAPHLWEPDDPYLYQLRIAYGTDRVQSYCAFRTVGVEPDAQGVPRFCLNHRPLFVRGLLDQGYWPDGLMTAPSDEAMVADIQAARAAGFNMLRKHIKVEPERWYWHCDRLGMLVWQDMVSGGDVPGEWASVNVPTLLRASWSALPDTAPWFWRKLGAGDAAYRAAWQDAAVRTVRHLAGHPCVATWVVFNESWGQFSSAEQCERLRAVDNTRPYVATSGWYDQGAGDYLAVHNYFRSMRVYRDPHDGAGRRRAFVIDEFGGLTCSVAGHVSVPTTYGYDAYDSLPSWRAALRALLAQVDALEADGLAGYVYTQLTDVEEETNGLLTYDRRVNKLQG